MISRRITLPEPDEGTRLPTLIRRPEFDSLLEAGALLSRAEARAEEIVGRARAEAEAMHEGAEGARRESEERGYREGRERARAEMAGELLEMTDMASSFLAEIEDSMVAAVTAGVREIVSTFDDVDLVEATVRRALIELGAGARATLSVPESLRDEIERRLGGIPGAESLSVVGDVSLHRGSCRLENARMVLTGGVEEQLDAVRAAFESRVFGAREGVPPPAFVGEGGVRADGEIS